MNALQTKEAEWIERYLQIPDPQERLSAVVSKGKKAVELPPGVREEENLVPGCTSQVYLRCDLVDKKAQVWVDADAPVIKGLVVLLAELVQGSDPEDVATFEPVIFERLGIVAMLTPTRQNGIYNVYESLRKGFREILGERNPDQGAGES